MAYKVGLQIMEWAEGRKLYCALEYHTNKWVGSEWEISVSFQPESTDDMKSFTKKIGIWLDLDLGKLSRDKEARYTAEQDFEDGSVLKISAYGLKINDPFTLLVEETIRQEERKGGGKKDG